MLFRGNTGGSWHNIGLSTHASIITVPALMKNKIYRVTSIHSTSFSCIVTFPQKGEVREERGRFILSGFLITSLYAKSTDKRARPLPLPFRTPSKRMERVPVVRHPIQSLREKRHARPPKKFCNRNSRLGDLAHYTRSGNHSAARSCS